MKIKKWGTFFCAAVVFFVNGLTGFCGDSFTSKKYKESDMEEIIVTLNEKSLSEGADEKDIDYARRRAENCIREYYPEFKAEYNYKNLVSGFSGKVPREIVGRLTCDPYIETAEKCTSLKKVSALGKLKESSSDYKDSSNKTGKSKSSADNGENRETYTGKGKVLAVLDSEIDINHKAFSGENIKGEKLSKNDIISAENSGKLNAAADQRAYISPKLPFVYNYVDSENPYNYTVDKSSGIHGTSVSAIAAGNNISSPKGEFSGAASNAQIIFMNIFTYDEQLGAYFSDDAKVLAALEDAAELKADAINMSFGEDTEVLIGSAYQKACENAIENGTAIFAAAGNLSESRYSPENPDNSTILSPSAISGVMSVVSCGKNGISSFSSKGVSESLELKPDITAEGENIYAPSADGNFQMSSGTSMASPKMAGDYLVLCESLEKKYPEKSRKEISIMAQNILMNSASVLTDEKGLPVSPRYQGAGRANMENAMNCTLVLTGKEGKGKINLYDSISNKIELGINTKNLSGKELFFENADITVITDDCVSRTSQKGKVISGTKQLSAECDLSGLKKIGSKEKSTKKITLNLNKDELEKNLDEFSNGFFIEGFISLSGEKNGLCCDISIPFLGFYGNWSNVPIFASSGDVTAETGCENVCVSNMEEKENSLANIVCIGQNTVDGSKGSDGRMYISPNGDGKGEMFGFDMNNLRESIDTSVEILDGKKCISSERFAKCINRGYSNTQILAENLESLKDGREYTAALSGKINYKNAGFQSIEKKFWVDKTSPEIIYSKVYDEKDRKYAELKLSDESRLDGVIIVGKGSSTHKNKIRNLPEQTFLFTENTIKKAGYNYADTIVNKSGKTMTVKYDVTNLSDYKIIACDGAFNTVAFSENNSYGTDTDSKNSDKSNGEDKVKKGGGKTGESPRNLHEDNAHNSQKEKNVSTGSRTTKWLMLCAYSLLGMAVFKKIKKHKQ